MTFRSSPVLWLGRCLVILAIGGGWQPAPAEESATCDCRRDCQERRDPSSGLAFDDEQHRLWYEVRFWQGECDDSLSWCFTGDDWYDLMEEVLERVPAAEQAKLCPRLWDLGRRIGHEWARDNDVRRIDTSDLEDWQEAISESGDLPATLTETEALVADRLQ